MSPLIGPPPNEEPKEKELIYTPPPGLTAWEDKRRVEMFLNVAPWKCECGITNFGRNLNCARDTCKKLRPANYKKNP